MKQDDLETKSVGTLASGFRFSSLGLGLQIVLSLAFLFLWGVTLSYIETTDITLRLCLEAVWIAAFLWIHVFEGSVSISRLSSRLASVRRTISHSWAAGTALGILALVSRPWSWSYESGVCHQSQLVASRFKIATLQGHDVGSMLAIALITTAAYPLLEEFAFRKWLLRPVTQRFGPLFGVCSTAALFAVLHLRPSTLLSDFVFGLLLGYAAIVTGSVVAPLLLHYGANLSLHLLTTRNLQPFLVGGLEKGVFDCLPSVSVSLVFVSASFFLLFRLGSRFYKPLTGQDGK